jgi:cytoskeletal protein RodZ
VNKSNENFEPDATQSGGVQLPQSEDVQSLEDIPFREEIHTELDSHPNLEIGETGSHAWRMKLEAFVRGISKPHSVPADEFPQIHTGETEKPAAKSQAEAEPMSNAIDFNPLPPESAESPIASDQVFTEIGQRLRQRREMLSLTYEEIERHTHVRTILLRALEHGALDELPSPVQTRGILANYAGFLDLDVDSILLRFADGVQARYREKGPRIPSRSRAPMTVNTNLPPLRSFIASDLIFGGGIAIMLLLFAIWGIGRVMTVHSATAPQATSPSISDVLAGTALPTLAQQVTLIPAQNTLLAPAVEVTVTLLFETQDPNVNVEINLKSNESTYMRVTVDGKVQFEGRTAHDSDYPYRAARQIEILVGNGSALRVIYNGRDQGLMGNFGEVVDRIYTAQGIVTPTSTPPPTQTPTPNITSTPLRTITPTPSLTPTKKPGG